MYINDLASKYGLRKSGNKFTGRCPQCGGSSTTDRFVLFSDGGYKCFSCAIAGSHIDLLIKIEGMGCKEAHAQAGADCNPSCPHHAKCHGGGEIKAKTVRSVAPRAITHHTGTSLPMVTTRTPHQLWLGWAEALVSSCHATLAKMPEQLAWLAARGVSAAAAEVNRLGWLGHDIRIDRASIGLAPERDGKTKLWVPGGLIIPVFSSAGYLQQIRIRRTPEALAKFLPNRKYHEVEGSGNEPLVIGLQQAPRGVVVVEAELDAMAIAASHAGVIVIGLRSVANGVPSWMRDVCSASPAILVCLDADQGKDGKPGAGQQAVARWTAEFRRARYWPTPAGKDPGDYVRDHQGDLRAWIEAGLPPSLPSVSAAISADNQSQQEINTCQNDDLPPLPDGYKQGGRGGEYTLRCITLTGGQEIYITDDREEWEYLADSGEVVFSAHELSRLQAAIAGMGQNERFEAILAVVAAKQEFPQAYIRRGEVRK